MAKVEHKLARLCWNTARWRSPSGSEGKSTKTDAFERKAGFGGEEWLFDTDKLIDGYHYGYVRAVSLGRDKYEGASFDLSLYSIHSKTRQRWWIGTIHNVTVVGENESAEVYRHYLQQGWIQQMRLQVAGAGAAVDTFDHEMSERHFAVLKYRMEDLALLDTPLAFEHGDAAVTSDYYNLKNFVGLPKLRALTGEFEFRAGHVPPADKTRIEYDRQDRQVNNQHNHIQTRLFEILCQRYGEQNVGTENSTGAGSRVDLVVRRRNKFVLYEIKAWPTLAACVREAVGQLLEYRHHIGSKKVERLVIVSPHTSTPQIEEYLDALRTVHSLPIFYEQCTVDGNTTATSIG